MLENEKSVSSLFSELGTDDHISSSNKPVEVDSWRHFYDIFNREVDEYDRDFHKKYHDDPNATQIFVNNLTQV